MLDQQEQEVALRADLAMADMLPCVVEHFEDLPELQRLLLLALMREAYCRGCHDAAVEIVGRMEHIRREFRSAQH